MSGANDFTTPKTRRVTKAGQLTVPSLVTTKEETRKKKVDSRLFETSPVCAVFSSMIDFTPPTTGCTSSSTRETVPFSPDSQQPMSLVDRLRIKTQAVSTFLRYFDATLNARKTWPSPKYPVDLLPDAIEFHVFFREAMSSATCPFMQVARLSSVAEETLRKAAASTVHFLVFMEIRRRRTKEQEQDEKEGKEEEEEVVVLVLEEETEEKRCDAVVNLVKRMTVQEKANLVGEFIAWFERVPPVRISSSKVASVSGLAARASVKESSTLMTVVRGLLAFFTYVGIIEPSSDRSPTEESKSIWRTVRTCMKLTDRLKGGKLDMTKSALGFADTIRLMVKSPGVRSLFELQSWLFSLTLAGLGVRVGSIRNAYPKKREIRRLQTRKRSYFDDDVDEEDVDEDDDDEEEDDHDELTFEFDSLVGSDLRVWRRRSKIGDPQGSIRLRVVLNITHSKTSGTESFTPKSIGAEYPRISIDGSEDWQFNIAAVLALLSCFCGITSAEHFVSDEFNPKTEEEEVELTGRIVNSNSVPLFRKGDRHKNLTPERLMNISNSVKSVADSLRIPSALFTSKSYRCGYARDVVQSIVTRGDGQQVHTLDTLRQTLLSGTQWKSAQVDRYLTGLSRSLAAHPVTGASATAFDWQSAIFHDLACAKVDYVHIDARNLLAYTAQTSRQSSTSLSHIAEMIPSEITTLCSAINVKNWRASDAIALSPAERKEFLLAFPNINLVATIARMRDVLNTENRPFSGYGWTPKDGTDFMCPVIGCKKSLHKTIMDTHNHWAQQHETSKRSLFYFCLKCSNTAPSNHRSYCNHLRKRHTKEEWSFNFVLDDDSL